MTDHIHHWMLPPPDGPTVPGACKCGETKEFPASMDLMTRSEYTFNRPLTDEDQRAFRRDSRVERERAWDERDRRDWA